MTVIRRADARRTQTPNAVMTTLASPTQGGAAQSLWRVDMTPGQSGPLHTFDAEQLWAVLAGGAVITLDGAAVSLEPGDTAVIPAEVPRQVTADGGDGLSAIVTAQAGARAAAAGADPVVPPWIA
jgi:quercetin dioxygenase-like cupin family protein